VEFNEVLLILGLFLPIFFVAIWQLNRINPSKKGMKRARDQADTSVSELIGVQNAQTKVIVDQKNNYIKSLEKKLSNLEEYEDEEPEEIADLVKNPEIQTLLKAKGINPALMDNPIIQKYIKKYTKGMSIEQVLEIAQQLGFLKPGKQPQGPLEQTQPVEYNKDWA